MLVFSLSQLNLFFYSYSCHYIHNKIMDEIDKDGEGNLLTCHKGRELKSLLSGISVYGGF
jgi:hypothetical protein